jgi:[ribosomal protein S18]-alanine N-acetyltransferase
MILTRVIRDNAGTFLLRQWKKTEKENIIPVEDSILSEIFRIQAEGLKK